MCLSFPVRFGAKPVFLVPLLILAGCIFSACGGGGASEPSVQTLHGPGSRFEAPAAGKVPRREEGVAAGAGVARVGVPTSKLPRRYEPGLFRAATRELDGN